MSRPHCPRCLRPTTHCLCALIPHLDSRTRVLLLQHPSEVGHALNTARLAALGLNNAQLVVGEVFDDLATLLNPPGYRARLLFPADEAEPLHAYAPDDQPLLLVVPDGTWRKAPGPGALSTVEAITKALQVLEAPTSFEPLLKPFEALIEGQIAAMGDEVFQRNHGDPT